MGYKKRVIQGTIISGTKVEVKHNKIELALKKLKNKVKDANILIDLREKQYYKK